jgi:hypothetical protein
MIGLTLAANALGTPVQFTVPPPPPPPFPPPPPSPAPPLLQDAIIRNDTRITRILFFINML